VQPQEKCRRIVKGHREIALRRSRYCWPILLCRRAHEVASVISSCASLALPRNVLSPLQSALMPWRASYSSWGRIASGCRGGALSTWCVELTRDGVHSRRGRTGCNCTGCCLAGLLLADPRPAQFLPRIGHPGHGPPRSAPAQAARPSRATGSPRPAPSGRESWPKRASSSGPGIFGYWCKQHRGYSLRPVRS
jgi:hypothetical protein